MCGPRDRALVTPTEAYTRLDLWTGLSFYGAGGTQFVPQSLIDEFLGVRDPRLRDIASEPVVRRDA